MWLRNGDHSVLVSPQGGSILQWQYKEHMILGPARMVRIGDELKTRGESHWCYPNFGTPPPEWAILGKHGPFRKLLLEPRFGQTFQSARFEKKEDRSQGSEMEVSYDIGLDGLQAKFSVHHTGAATVPILPAFHPYFAVPPEPEKGLWVVMGENRYSTITFSTHKCGASRIGPEARIVERDEHLIEVVIGEICRVKLDLPDDCTHIAIWSDHPASYVCVEPIFGKPGTFGKPEGRWLEPGERVECNVRLDFEEIK